MKSRDASTLSTLRMLKSALMEAKTKKPKDQTLTAEEEIEVVRRYSKKRRETIAEFEKLGRHDLIESEKREIEVASRYLPQSMGEDELRALVQDTIRRTGASTAKDAGKVIGAVMAQAKGTADGSLVSKLVREALA